MEGEPQPLRSFDDLSLPERFDAIMAVTRETPPLDILQELIGTPRNVQPEEIPQTLQTLLNQREQKIVQATANGEKLPAPEETFQRLHIDPATVHKRITEVIEAKIGDR